MALHELERDDLPTLAVYTAGAIEQHLNKYSISKEIHEDNQEAVERLSTKLQEATEEPLDLKLFCVISDMLWPMQEDKREKRKDDIILQTHLFAKELKNYQSLSRERQEELKDYCLELFDKILAYENSLHYYRTYHGPYANQLIA